MADAQTLREIAASMSDDDWRHLRHFQWLEKEDRHNLNDDPALNKAVRQGWIVRLPSRMTSPLWTRVRLTPLGRALAASQEQRRG